MLISLGISMSVCLACDHHSHVCSQWGKTKDDKNWWSNKGPIFTTSHNKSAKKLSQWLRNSGIIILSIHVFPHLFLFIYSFLFLSQTPFLSKCLFPHLNTFYFKCSSSIPLYVPFHCHAFSASCPTSLCSSLWGLEVAKSSRRGWESWAGRREWNKMD